MNTVAAKPWRPLKTIAINNRRYLGNKYKLLPFIAAVIGSECPKVNSVADIFAGTGSVASAFTDKRLITNDHLYSNYICHVAWFGPGDYSPVKVEELIGYYNYVSVTEENYLSVNFADTFFSRADCRRIGFIREDIERRFRSAEINERERALLIASLLYSADKIAETCGHYDAYRQGAAFGRPLELAVLRPPENLNLSNECYNEDANKLVRRIYADLVYIDPPYNSRQYCDAYHLPENIARWEKPQVRGVSRKMDRTGLKSDYCTRRAAAAFADLIEHVNARYIVLSYSNMAIKGHDRSNARISDDELTRILSRQGEVRVFRRSHKPFTAGRSNIGSHEERLFLCRLAAPKLKSSFIQPPPNYTGDKYRLLP